MLQWALRGGACPAGMVLRSRAANCGSERRRPRPSRTHFGEPRSGCPDGRARCRTLHARSTIIFGSSILIRLSELNRIALYGPIAKDRYAATGSTTPDLAKFAPHGLGHAAEAGLAGDGIDLDADQGAPRRYNSHAPHGEVRVVRCERSEPEPRASNHAGRCNRVGAWFEARRAFSALAPHHEGGGRCILVWAESWFGPSLRLPHHMTRQVPPHSYASPGTR